MDWKRWFRTRADKWAVPLSAAIVSWIGAGAWLLPDLPDAFIESAALRFLIQAACALCGFLAARRLL